MGRFIKKISGLLFYKVILFACLNVKYINLGWLRKGLISRC